MSVCASARWMAVPMAYRLFSQMNTTGSFQSDARFRDSWNSPWGTEPSPKKQRMTRSRSSYRMAKPTPAARGR